MVGRKKYTIKSIHFIVDTLQCILNYELCDHFGNEIIDLSKDDDESSHEIVKNKIVVRLSIGLE